MDQTPSAISSSPRETGSVRRLERKSLLYQAATFRVHSWGCDPLIYCRAILLAAEVSGYPKMITDLAFAQPRTTNLLGLR